MSLVFGISSARELLDKLRRNEARLLDALSTNDEEAIGDALFDFAVTGHSVKDWAKQAAASAASSIDVEAFVKANVNLQACRDIANSSKHQSITQYVAATARVYASANAVYSVSVGGKQEPIDVENYAPFKIKVLMNDGIKIELREFARNVVAAWDRLLHQLGV